jgi:hypothetical protein
VREVLFVRQRTCALLAGGLLGVLGLAGCGNGSALDATDALAAATVRPTAGQPVTAGKPTASVSALPAPPDLEYNGAVKALRREYTTAAEAVNQQNSSPTGWLLSSTTARRRVLPTLWKKEFGLRVPGPIPFTPLSVAIRTSSQRVVDYCVVTDGWLQDPKTGDPVGTWTVTRAKAISVKVHGVWKVDSAVAVAGGCPGIHPKKEYFDPDDN